MKFIRDIIAERSQPKVQEPDPVEPLSDIVSKLSAAPSAARDTDPAPEAVLEDDIDPIFDALTAETDDDDTEIQLTEEEEADADTGASDAADEDAAAEEPAQPAGPRYRDRTLTRLSDQVVFDDDDIFRRLLQDSSLTAPEEDEPDLNADAEDASTAEEGMNLFSDGEAAEDPSPAQPDPQVMASPSPRMAPKPAEDASPEAAADQPAEDERVTFGGLPGRASPPPVGKPASSAEADEDEKLRHATEMVAVPAPAFGRSGRGAGRVKTRLLGFGAPEAPRDPFQTAAQASDADLPAAERTDPAAPLFPVGWLVVTSGPGRGAAFTLQSGVSQIGRGEDQAVRLDYGDTSISRTNHAAIAYDEEQETFFLGHGGKANMVRLNDRPVLSTEEITDGAVIRIGETSLRFRAFCDTGFNWKKDGV